MLRTGFFHSLTQVLVGALLLVSGTAAGQTPVVLISEGGTQNYCNALFYDSGGPNGMYGDNQDQVITFCPGVPGDSIQIGFYTADIAPGDVLTIYDGPNTSSPVLASSNGTDPLAGNLWTANNSGGCITIRFVSNGSLVYPGWSALIQCNNPCPQPTASFPPFPESPYKVCPYDTLLIDGSASYAAPGRTVASYAWSIAGATTYSTSPVVDLPTPVPGEFPISLQVMDDIGCVSTNSSAELVRVATYPDFTGTLIGPSTICEGESATLTGRAEGTLWSSLPEPIITGEFVLPDACPPPASYNGYINVSGFPAGTTISASDILEVCMTIEHSYLGDLTVSMICPDGGTVVLFDGYANGGGGTYLGGATDDSEGIPGVGAQYCFTPNAAWGTITEENDAGNWVQAGQPPNNSMTPGTYSPQGSFNSWNGCNLNGTWTLVVEDHLCIDDGTLFNASMSINPALYPDIIEFTPVVGQGCDSVAWTGPNITSTTADCTGATVGPDHYGSYPYTYHVTDDFGCTFDTTFTLTVTPPVTFTVGATTPEECTDPVLLYTVMQAPAAVGPFTYRWWPAAGLSNPNTATPFAFPTVNTWYKVEVYPTGHQICGMIDSIFVHRITDLGNDTVITEPLCFGLDGSVEVLTTGSGGPWNYTWTDSTGTVVRTTMASAGDVFNGPDGVYQVRIEEGPEGNGCIDSLVVTITQPDLLEISSMSPDTTICLTGTANVSLTAQGGTAPITYVWDHTLSGSGPFQLSPTDTTSFSLHAVDANGCISNTRSITIGVLDPLGLVLPDTLTICPGVDTVLVAANAFGGDGTYSYDWGQGPAVSPGKLVNLLASQNVCVTLSDGCETPPIQRCTYFKVKRVPPVVLSADTVLGCAPLPVRFSIVDTTTMGQPLAAWDFGDGSVLENVPLERNHTYTRAGHFDVTAAVRWPNYCVTDTTIPGMVVLEPLPKADFSWTPYPPDILAPTVHFTQQTGPYATAWQWVINESDTVEGPEASYVFPNDVGGTYPVFLRTENYLGCADSTTRMVLIGDAFLVYAPTAFTPDGDGINDLFFLKGNDIDPNGFDLSVFDRWGHEVFHTDDPFHPWDGVAGSGPAIQGVYVWKAKVRSAFTLYEEELHGHVTLVR